MPVLDGGRVRAPATMPEIAHFIAYTGTAMGGPVHSMAAYARVLVDVGCPVTVYTSARESDGKSVQLDSRVRLVQGAASARSPFRYSGALRQQAQAAQIDLIHSHGLWTDANWLAGHTARTRRLPHLLAPCGMLAPGALRHHRWRKKAALIWFQERILSEAKCFHAKSEKEYEDIRQFGLRNPVAIIANPIAEHPERDPASEKAFRAAHHISGDARILLYLGRLHPVKGLSRLIHAWSEVGKLHQDWSLILAGPDEAGHRKEIESLASQLDCQDRLVFTGELDETNKWVALQAASLFVMPSDFENFGTSIVEAMSCGVPVITTTGTPWKELPAAGAGWCVEPNPQALARALQDAFSMSNGGLQHMGLRAATIADKFRPGEIRENLIAVYNWLLKKNPKPSCVTEF